MNTLRNKILIIEDDPAFSLILKMWCQKNGYDPVAVYTIAAAQQEVVQNSFDLILSDLRLPDSDGIMFLTWLKDKKDETPIIILTNYADIQTAVVAIKLGAFDFMEKPINHLIMKEKVEAAMLKKTKNEEWSIENTGTGGKSAKKRNAAENSALVDESSMVIGVSKAAKEMFTHIRLVAPTDISVLILGESGTGKEQIAHFIHKQSKRNKAPFIAVDCGALSKELAASELFGHLKGSFTSAISDKVGVFEAANGGTLFFDEVGNLPYEVQKQLLRTLQERKIRKVGDIQEIAVDVRLICATNEDLTQSIQAGRFREDLYHRLLEFTIDVPPLKNRIDDIELFCDFFIKQANQEVSKEVKNISPEALTILKQQPWKGNLRELRNTLRRAVLFASGNTILPEHLPVFQKETMPPFATLFNEKEEKQRIINALQQCSGNKTIAAKMLNVDRKTLYNKMHAYEIELK